MKRFRNAGRRSSRRRSESPSRYNELVERDLLHLLRSPVFQFDGSIFEALRANDYAKGHAEQIGVLEFHPGAEPLAVVVQDFKAGGLELTLGPFSSRRDLRLARVETEQVHVEGATGHGQMMPSVSCPCSTTAATVRVMPMP